MWAKRQFGMHGVKLHWGDTYGMILNNYDLLIPSNIGQKVEYNYDNKYWRKHVKVVQPL